MKEKYEQPIVLITLLQQTDVITSSFGDGDNTLEDSFFD